MPPNSLMTTILTLVPEQRFVPDAELLERFVSQRDDEAFAALVERHGPMVLATCRRALSVADAEDVAQSVFLALARQVRSIRQAQALAGWLHRTAYQLSLKHRRTEARRRQREQRVAVAASIPEPLEDLTRSESLRIVDEELQRLPERERIALILCSMEGCTQQEAARRLGWTPGAVKGRLERGRARLHDRLRQRGVTPSALPPVPLPPGFVSAARVAASVAGPSGNIVLLKFAGLLLLLGLVAAGLVAAPMSEPQPKQAQNQTQPAKPEVRQDRHGDPLPAGEIARLGTLRWRTADKIEHLAFAPDGKTLAVAWGNGVPPEFGQLGMFDAEGRLVRIADPDKIQGPAHMFGPMQFSPDDKRLAWPCRILGEPDDKDLVYVLDPKTGKKLQEIEAPGWQRIGWSAQGKLLIVALSKEGVVIQEPDDRKSKRFQIADLPPPAAWLHPCACDPETRTVAIADRGGTVHVLDGIAGKKRLTISTKGIAVRSIAFSAGGKSLVAIVEDQVGRGVRIWDLQTGKILRDLAGDRKDWESVLSSPNGKTLATIARREIRFHDTQGREQGRCGDLPFLPQVAFSLDGKTLATAQHVCDAVRLWDVPSGKPRPQPPGHANFPTAIDFSPDGKHILSVGSYDETLVVWNRKTAEAVHEIHTGSWLRSGMYASDGRSILATGFDATISYFDSATGKKLHTIAITEKDTEHTGAGMLLSSDRTTLIASGRAWRKSDNTTLGLYVAAFDATSRKPLFRRLLPGRYFQPTVSPCGKMLATQPNRKNQPDDGPITIEETQSGKRLVTLPAVKGLTLPLGFSADSRLLATAQPEQKAKGRQGNRIIRFWERETGKEVLELTGAFSSVVAFSGDGRSLAWAAPQGEIHVWDMRYGKMRHRITGIPSALMTLAFAPDGKHLLSGHLDSCLLVWTIPDRGPEKPALTDAKSLNKAWADLGGDAKTAFAARGALASSPLFALPLLTKQLQRNAPVGPQTADTLRTLRAVAVLEDIGTKAQPLLRHLAGGRGEERLTQEAKEALIRLTRREQEEP